MTVDPEIESDNIRLMRYEAPLEQPLVEELFAFWEPIFGGPIDIVPETLLGSEGRSLSSRSIPGGWKALLPERVS